MDKADRRRRWKNVPVSPFVIDYVFRSEYAVTRIALTLTGVSCVLVFLFGRILGTEVDERTYS